MQYTSNYMMILKQNNINNDNRHVSVCLFCHSTREHKIFQSIILKQCQSNLLFYLRRNSKRSYKLLWKKYHNFVLSRKSPPHNMACYICKPIKLAQHKADVIQCITINNNMFQWDVSHDIILYILQIIFVYSWILIMFINICCACQQGNCFMGEKENVSYLLK